MLFVQEAIAVRILDLEGAGARTGCQNRLTIMNRNMITIALCNGRLLPSYDDASFRSAGVVVAGLSLA